MTQFEDVKFVNLIEKYQEGFVDRSIFKSFLIKNKIISLAHMILLMKNDVLLIEEAFIARALKELLLISAADVIDLLNKHQIPFKTIKGLYLIEKYPEYSQFRDIKDIDFLVEAKDLDLALKLLQEHGWKADFSFTGCKKRLELFINHSITLVHLESGVELDLHWKLAEVFICNPEFSLDYWKHTETIKQKHYEVDLNWEYQVLLLAIHSYKNNWMQAQNFIDLDVILQRSIVDFQKLVELADKYQLNKILTQTLDFYNEFFNNKVQPIHKTDSHSRFNEIHNIIKYNTFSNKLKNLAYRYLLPFGPDLNSKHSICKIFITKYIRFIFNRDNAK